MTDTELSSGVTDKQMSVANEKSDRKVGYSVALKSASAAAASSSQARLNGISAGINKNLPITIAAGFPAADTYSDTITLTLTNN